MTDKKKWTFWQFTSSGGAVRKRWCLSFEDEPLGRRLRFRSIQGKRMTRDEILLQPPVLLYDTLRMEDMPSVAQSVHVVSDRLRQFLEEQAPDTAEYFPVEIVGPGQDQIKTKYWAINWIAQFDCLHEQSYNEDDDGRYVEVPIIDVSRIPQGERVGLLSGFSVVTLMREDLKKQIASLGFTGPQFYKIAHSDGTNFIPYIRAPRKP